MTDSGKFLWENIAKGAEEAELVKLLMQEYGIDSDTATADVNEFVDMLKTFGIV